MMTRRSKMSAHLSTLARLLLLAVATLSCDPQPSPVAPGTRTSSRDEGASVRSMGTPAGSFRTTPGASSDQEIRVALGTLVTISGARFTAANPDDELKLEVEWGDGQRSTNGCGPCRVDHVYGAGVYQLTATVHDRRLADRGSATQSYTVIVPGPAQTESTATPGPSFCHSINLATGAACPTGATQFCDTVPIVATSSAQARLACEACTGVTCVATSQTWTDLNLSHYSFIVISPPMGCPSTIVPGDISNGCFISGRWAP
jgi:hypothetical protein